MWILLHPSYIHIWLNVSSRAQAFLRLLGTIYSNVWKRMQAVATRFIVYGLKKVQTENTETKMLVPLF